MDHPPVGLSGSEVLHSRREYGSNQIPVPPTQSFWEKYLENFEDPLIRILCVCVVLVMIQSYYGYASITESFGILFSILISTTVGTLSEYRSEATFTKLQAESSVTSVLCYRRGFGCNVDTLYSTEFVEQLRAGWQKGVNTDEALQGRVTAQTRVECINPSSYVGKGEVAVAARDRGEEEHIELLSLDINNRRTITSQNFSHTFRVPLSVEDLVVGDLIVLSAGDCVPADGYLMSGYVLVNQKSLTGEDVGIPKHACTEYHDVFPFTPIGIPLLPNGANDDLDSAFILYRGGLIEEGSGVMRIMSVGIHTQYAKSMRVAEEEEELNTEEDVDMLIVPLNGEYNPYEEELGLTSLSASPSVHRAPDEAPSEIKLIKQCRAPPLKRKLQSLADLITHVTYKLAAVMAAVFMFKQIWMDHDYDTSAVLGYLQNLGLVFHDFLTAVMLSIVVLVVSVPEGLPMMIAIVLSLNMRKLQQENVQVRRLVGIETAGSLSLLCVDKTGTLTAGVFKVKSCFDQAGKNVALNTLQGVFIKASCIDSSVTVKQAGGGSNIYTSEKGTSVVGSNSSDRAILAFLVDNILGNKTDQFSPVPGMHSRSCASYEDICSGFTNHVSISNKQLFTSTLKKNSICIAIDPCFLPARDFAGLGAFCTMGSTGKYELRIVKGAAEMLLQQCTHSYNDKTQTISVLTEQDVIQVTRKFNELSERGERLIALCLAQGDDKPGLCLVCVFALSDSLRASTRQSVATQHQAHVQVMMITGDRRETAVTIAQEAGVLAHADNWGALNDWAKSTVYANAHYIDYNLLLCFLNARINMFAPSPCIVLTSSQMKLQSDFELAWFLPYICVVARSLPSDKTRLVQVAQNRHILLAGLGGEQGTHKNTGCLSMLRRAIYGKDRKAVVSARQKDAKEFVHQFHTKFFTMRAGKTPVDATRYKESQYWTGVHKHRIQPSDMTFDAVFGTNPPSLSTSVYSKDTVTVGPPMVVGMVGDGINDSGALKVADVSIAMGSATEVTKETADVVLLDDNLDSVVNSVQYGRTIFTNIRKFITFQCTVNASALCCCILGPLLGFDLPLTLVQLLWVNLVMDTLAALAFGGESSTRRCQQDHPFPQNGHIIGKPMWRSIACNGLYIATLSILFLTWDPIVIYFSRTSTGPTDMPTGISSSDTAPARNPTPERMHYEGGLVYQTAFFNFFVISNTLHAFNVRSEQQLNIVKNQRQNVSFIIIILGIVGMQIIFTHLPLCNAVLRTTPLQLHEWAVVQIMASTVFIFDFIRKIVMQQYLHDLEPETLEYTQIDAAVEEFNHNYAIKKKLFQ